MTFNCGWVSSWGTLPGILPYKDHLWVTLRPPPADSNLALYAPADEEDARARLGDYLSRIERMVRWGKIQVVGHLTLPLRYFNGRRGFRLTFDEYQGELERILRLVVEKGLGIELNTNHGDMPLPDEKWLRMYRRLGGEIITLGSDAHRTGGVGCAIREGQALLRACGFRHFCTFERGMPVWHDL